MSEQERARESRRKRWPRLLVILLFVALVAPALGVRPAAAEGTIQPDGSSRLTDAEAVSSEAYWTDAAITSATAQMPVAGSDVSPDVAEQPEGPEECALGQMPDGTVPYQDCNTLTPAAAAAQGMTAQADTGIQYCGDDPNRPLYEWYCRMWTPGDSTYNYERPWIIHGKVFFLKSNGSKWSCSGTSVTSVRIVNGQKYDGNESLVWTAGHCLAPEGGNWPAFHTKVVFIPGYKIDASAPNGRRPYGTWSARALFARAWRQTGSWRQDYGVFVVTKKTFNGVQKTLADHVGTAGILFNDRSRRKPYHMHGYPSRPTATNSWQNGAGGKIWKCYGGYSGARYFSGPGQPAMGLGRRMGAGASGGGWFAPWSDTYAGTLRSNNSFVNNYDNPQRWWGPYLGTWAKDLWLAARNA